MECMLFVCPWKPWNYALAKIVAAEITCEVDVEGKKSAVECKRASRENGFKEKLVIAFSRFTQNTEKLLLG